MEMPLLNPTDRKEELIGAILLLVVLDATVVYRLWPHRIKLRALAVALLEELLSRKSKSEVDDPIERRVKEECQRRHLQRADVVIVLANLSAIGQLLFYLINIFTDVPLITLPQLLVWYVGLGLTISAAWLPRRFLTNISVDVLYCALMSCGVLTILCGKPDAASVNEFREGMMVMGIFYGLLDLKPLLNTFWLAMMAGATTVMMVRTGHTCVCVWNAYFFVAGVLFGIDYILTRGVRLEILAADSNNERVAVKTLLTTICDVIVELDSGLRLLAHSPKLSDVLLQGHGRDLQGADLRDYMPAEGDRAVFAERLGSADAAAAHADVFHSKLRDGTGGTVDVEFFSVAFQGSDSQRRHLLGMREYTDIQPIVPPQRPPPPFVPTMPRQVVDPLDPRWAGTPAGRKEGDLRSHSGTSRSGSSRGGDRSAGRAAAGAMETKEVAKLVTLTCMLMGWSVARAPDACCPLHVAIAELQRMAPKALSMPCRKDFGPLTRWQCQRCGIRDADYRNKADKDKCELCRSIDSKKLDGDGAEGKVAL